LIAAIICANYDTDLVAANARMTSAAPASLADTIPRASLPRLEIIAAVAANGVIGAGNRMPWHIPADLRRFRALTTGHAVIMGRKTWDSIGRALPQRQNIVVSRAPAFRAEGAEAATSLVAALALVALPAPAFCIGGGELYREALTYATALHLTEIDATFEGDASFPALDRARWRETARESHPADAPGSAPYAFVTYTRADS
jgi:dihydrofolate reductase